MKSESTIRREINNLQKIVRDDSTPEEVRYQAYEAWHALLWVVGDTGRVVPMIQRRAEQAKGKVTT